MAHRRAPEPAWTPFRPVTLSPLEIAGLGGPSLYLAVKNSRYEVYARRFDSPLGEMDWLMVKRLDRDAIRDWRDMQRIKDELLGPEREAVELYPAQSRMVDCANQFHLWVLPVGQQFPFGLPTRAVSEEQNLGSKQRPWPKDCRPADLMTDIQKQALSEMSRPSGRTFPGRDESGLTARKSEYIRISN